MKAVILALMALSAVVLAEVPAVPESASPDGKLHAVMDIDRNPTLSPEWKSGDYPRIEITERASGRILTSIEYFGAAGDDKRPLREHVQVCWRGDAKAFAITIQDRNYSMCRVYALSKKSDFIPVAFPSYESMTGFPLPECAQLSPRGVGRAKGWDAEGRLTYYLFLNPLPSYPGNDPLVHTVLLEVSAGKMVPVKPPKQKPDTNDPPTGDLKTK